MWLVDYSYQDTFRTASNLFWGLITGAVFRGLSKLQQNELYDYVTSETARLAGIPVLWCGDRCWSGWKLSMPRPTGLHQQQENNGLKVARYSFSRSIPPKFERKLRRHKQRFGKIDTTVVLDKDENLLWSGLQWHRNQMFSHIFRVVITGGKRQ